MQLVIAPILQKFCFHCQNCPIKAFRVECQSEWLSKSLETWLERTRLLFSHSHHAISMTQRPVANRLWPHVVLTFVPCLIYFLTNAQNHWVCDQASRVTVDWRSQFRTVCLGGSSRCKKVLRRGSPRGEWRRECLRCHGDTNKEDLNIMHWLLTSGNQILWTINKAYPISLSLMIAYSCVVMSLSTHQRTAV